MKWAAILLTVVGAGVILLGVASLSVAAAPNLTVGNDQSAAPTNEVLDCEQVITLLEQHTSQVDCSGLPNSSACYGSSRVDVKARGAETLAFNKPGDQEPLAKLAAISTRALDLTTGEWGMALLSTRVMSGNRVVTNQPLIFVLYGDTTVEDITDSDESTSGAVPEYLHAFYFDNRSVGLVPECRDLPIGGLIIDSPDGFQVSFVANGAELTIGSTVMLQAAPYDDMTVTVIEGKATVTADGQSVTATSGQQAVVPLGSGHNGLEANGTPQLREADALPLGLPGVCQIMSWSGLNVPCALSTVVPEPAATIGPYVTARVNSNVRTGDTTYHDVVGVLRSGQTAPVLGVSCTGSGWYVVELNGQQGYISNAAVTLTGSISGLPCFNPPSLSSPLDTDGDGFNDTADLCPNIPGTDNGCPPPTAPDPDADGFSGELDRCPDIPGTENGCPLDSDSDTVPDDEDSCPYDYGSPDNYGCPFDSDSDTVPDDEDSCPYDYGSPDNYGCPFDSDGDTVPDDEDSCPYDYGSPDNYGCPFDSDSDTVPDDQDSCPYEYGSPDNYGCPFDSDGDTVPDDQDSCPYEYGSPDNYGCPLDSDSDTVPDDQDSCPYEYGPPDNSGCPGVIVN